MSAADYGLGEVENLPRSVDRPKRTIPAGSEPCDTGTTGLASDLPTGLGEQSLAEAAEAAKNGDGGLDDTLKRIAPHDGSRVLLVAASFNSAI